MELNKFYAITEDAIQTLGLDPTEARGEEGQWFLHRAELEIYIDVWQPTEHSQWEYFKEDEPTPMFQVVAPICFLPEDEKKRSELLEEILYINFHLFYVSFSVNHQENLLVLSFRRLLEGLNRVEMIEPIESIGYYGQTLQPYLCEKYGAKKIE